LVAAGSFSTIWNPTYTASNVTSSGGNATLNFTPSVTLPHTNDGPLTVTSASWSGTVETLNYTPQDPFLNGQSITVSGLSGSPGTPNGPFVVTSPGKAFGTLTVNNPTLTGSGHFTLTAAQMTYVNVITVAGVSEHYTPTSASWSGQAQTVNFTPADTIQVGALVTISGLSCTLCGGSPNVAELVTSSSPGSMTIVNPNLGKYVITPGSATWTGTTEKASITPADTFSGSVTLAGLTCPSGVSCGLPNGTFTASVVAGAVTLTNTGLTGSGGTLGGSGTLTWGGNPSGTLSLSATPTLVQSTLGYNTTVSINGSAPGSVSFPSATTAPGTGGTVSFGAPGGGAFSAQAYTNFGSGPATLAGTPGSLFVPTFANLPIMLDIQANPDSFFQRAGSVTILAGATSSSVAAQIINPPATNACVN
jgi:hypothetical protein